MQVGDPTPKTIALNPAQVLPVRPIVRQTGDERAAARDRRDNARGDAPSFRATLDATLPQGVAAQFTPTQTNLGSTQAPRPEKRPSSSELEIDGSESAQLLADTLNTARAGKSHDGTAEIMPTAAQQRHRTVAHQYAQSFFSVGGTFAARGDQLEVSA